MKNAPVSLTWIVTAGGYSAAEQASSPITSLWATGSQDERVEIYHCGASLCGTIVDAALLRTGSNHRDVKNPDRKLHERRLKGLMVLQGFRAGPAEWAPRDERQPAENL